MKILITGGTGLIGKQLSKLLLDKGYEIAILSRNPKGKNQFHWNISENYIDEKALQNITHIIHLAGAGIADKRWTPERKKTIINSRVNSANLLVKKVQELNIPLQGFISASGVGYYGAVTSNIIFTENDAVANDFLGDVCQQWENAAHQFSSLQIPVTILRTGIVLSDKGGALAKMQTPIISPLGSGKQFMPWIHIDDLCNLYLQAIEEKLIGIFNAVAPEHQSNTEFSKLLAKHTKRPFLNIGVPKFALHLAFGEMADILLKGSRISAKKLLDAGFNFQFKTLNDAFKNLFVKDL